MQSFWDFTSNDTDEINIVRNDTRWDLTQCEIIVVQNCYLLLLISFQSKSYVFNNKLIKLKIQDHARIFISFKMQRIEFLTMKNYMIILC